MLNLDHINNSFSQPYWKLENHKDVFIDYTSELFKKRESDVVSFILPNNTCNIDTFLRIVDCFPCNILPWLIKSALAYIVTKSTKFIKCEGSVSSWVLAKVETNESCEDTRSSLGKKDIDPHKTLNSSATKIADDDLSSEIEIVKIVETNESCEYTRPSLGKKDIDPHKTLNSSATKIADDDLSSEIEIVKIVETNESCEDTRPSLGKKDIDPHKTLNSSATKIADDDLSSEIEIVKIVTKAPVSAAVQKNESFGLENPNSVKSSEPKTIIHQLDSDIEIVEIVKCPPQSFLNVKKVLKCNENANIEGTKTVIPNDESQSANGELTFLETVKPSIQNCTFENEVTQTCHNENNKTCISSTASTMYDRQMNKQLHPINDLKLLKNKEKESYKIRINSKLQVQEAELLLDNVTETLVCDDSVPVSDLLSPIANTADCIKENGNGSNIIDLQSTSKQHKEYEKKPLKKKKKKIIPIDGDSVFVPSHKGSANEEAAVLNNKIQDRVSGNRLSQKKIKRKILEKDRDSIMVPLLDGWRREAVYRQIISYGKKRFDIYYFAPDGRKLRSLPEVIEYLFKNNIRKYRKDNFCFSRIYNIEEPYESIRNAAFKKKTTLVTIKCKEPTKITKAKVKKNKSTKSIHPVDDFTDFVESEDDTGLDNFEVVNEMGDVSEFDCLPERKKLKLISNEYNNSSENCDNSQCVTVSDCNESNATATIIFKKCFAEEYTGAMMQHNKNSCNEQCSPKLQKCISTTVAKHSVHDKRHGRNLFSRKLTCSKSLDYTLDSKCKEFLPDVEKRDLISVAVNNSSSSVSEDKRLNSTTVKPFSFLSEVINKNNNSVVCKRNLNKSKFGQDRDQKNYCLAYLNEYTKRTGPSTAGECNNSNDFVSAKLMAKNLHRQAFKKPLTSIKTIYSNNYTSASVVPQLRCVSNSQVDNSFSLNVNSSSETNKLPIVTSVPESVNISNSQPCTLPAVTTVNETLTYSRSLLSGGLVKNCVSSISWQNKHPSVISVAGSSNFGLSQAETLCTVANVVDTSTCSNYLPLMGLANASANSLANQTYVHPIVTSVTESADCDASKIAGNRIERGKYSISSQSRLAKTSTISAAFRLNTLPIEASIEKSSFSDTAQSSTIPIETNVTETSRNSFCPRSIVVPTLTGAKFVNSLPVPYVAPPLPSTLPIVANVGENNLMNKIKVRPMSELMAFPDTSLNASFSTHPGVNKCHLLTRAMPSKYTTTMPCP